ncbi:MAG: lipocalin-like domain-containing protein [Candidatus Alcyoniella australis]|nr:lipocalin-like domain-containing protein [Candidatus Alcyoniella australis]
MRRLLRILFKTLGVLLVTLIGLALVGIIYGWADRGLLITTEDVEYAYPEDHPVQLPRDLAAHPEYKTEWWYFTGHLNDDQGGEYGFELVFFRIRTLGVWYNHVPLWWIYKTHATVAQFAVVDKHSGEHTLAALNAENSSSDVGALTEAMRVWTYDWFAQAEFDQNDELRLHIRADNGPYALDLELLPLKPAVLHGDNGLMRKQPNGVNSNYISYTRLAATGTLSVKGEPRPVTGLAWHDHEYASGSPSQLAAGWDWLSIQFDSAEEQAAADQPNPLDGAELMIYQVRSIDGQGLEGSKGTFVDREGTPQELLPDRDFTLQTGGEGVWTSPLTGAAYPLGWVVELPTRGWTVEVSPVAREQEVPGPLIDVNYWEGACTVTAHTPQGSITGMAYVELCGYDERVDKF